MELSAFGSILGFAIEREEEIRALAEKALKVVQTSPLRDLLGRIVTDCRKDVRTLERVRRENINEMIIAPVSGLDGDDYLFPTASIEDMSPEALVEHLDRVLRIAVRFYREAGPKIPIEEAARAFDRLARAKTALGESLKG